MSCLAASGGWDPLAFDPGTLFWTWVVFGVVVFILAKTAWGPLLRALEQREQKVRSGLEEAERAREEARRLSQEFEVKLREAQADAQRIAEEARARSERLAADIEAQAQDRAGRLLERAKREIALAQRQALEQVRELAVDLSIEAASAVLKKNLSADDNRELATKVIQMVRREGTGS